MTAPHAEDIELGNIDEGQRLLVRDLADGGQHRPESLQHETAHTNPPYNDESDPSSHRSARDPNRNPSPSESSGRSGTGIIHSENRINRLNTQLLEAIESRDVKEVKRLLTAGASPDATCRVNHTSACHLAALEGGETLALLLKSGAIKNRRDKHGRRPLHLAAWSGAARDIAMLLNFPDDLQNKVANDEMLLQTKEDVEELRPLVKQIVNAPCDVKPLLECPDTLVDSMAHSCREMRDSLPVMDVGWTPLHAASSNARPHCARLLLAAGAEPNKRDHKNRTPLDVAGSAYYHTHDIPVERETIKTLLEAGSKLTTQQLQILEPYDSPLHVAAELASLDAIIELLDAGASVTCLDRNGQTPLHLCVKKQLKKHLQILVNSKDENETPTVDAEDMNGNTVLHAAVEIFWMPGVLVTLETGADVIKKNREGHTPLHTAVKLGKADVLKEILNVAKHNNVIDCEEKGITPLMLTVINPNIKFMEEILNAGASIKKRLPKTMDNVLHIAAKNGYCNILEILLKRDDTKDILNERDSEEYTPILYAVNCNHMECFQLLFSKHIYISSQTNTKYDVSELMIKAVQFDRIEIAYEILKYDKTVAHANGDLDIYYNPFEYAVHRGSTRVLKLLLKNEASLLTDVADPAITGLASIFNGFPNSRENDCIEIFPYNKIDKPTEFIEDIFDEFIYTNKIFFDNSDIDRKIQDPKCVITVDYGILLPVGCEMEQMKVLMHLLETGNKNGQRRLLLHPLVESFIYLKWITLSKFFYVLLAFIGAFVLSLNIYIIFFYYYKDTEKPVLGFLDPAVWKYFVYVTVVFVLILECVNIKSKRSLFTILTVCCCRFVFVIMVIALPSIITADSFSDSEWPRHVATLVLLISWLEIMIFLSRTPYWGYYVLMFRKVATKVVMILLTFSLLVAAFAFSFMIQFHSQQPFEDPWAAFIKTMVMMTSEFDYSNTFGCPNDTETNKETHPQIAQDFASIILRRVLFVIFLILTAIVLMNLILGVAVTDLHNLVYKRKIENLEDQIMFLGSLEALVHHRFLPNCFKRRVESKIKIWPSEPKRLKYKLPKRILNAVFDNIQAQHELKDDNKDILTHEEKLHQIFKLGKNRESVKRFFENIPGWKYTTDFERILTPLDQISIEVQQIHVKLEQMSSKIKTMKHTLGRLESKH